MLKVFGVYTKIFRKVTSTPFQFSGRIDSCKPHIFSVSKQFAKLSGGQLKMPKATKRAVEGDTVPTPRKTRSRRAIKIEVEKDEEATSKSEYFQEGSVTVETEPGSKKAIVKKEEQLDGEPDSLSVTADGKVGKKFPTKPRSRRAIKIEVEKDEMEEEATSKSEYFQEGNEPASEQPDGQPDSLSVTADGKGGKKSPKKKVPLEVEPPKGWEALLENIKIMRSTKTAVVDTMGCERTADLTEEPKVQRFQLLVSLMLSSQTKDQVTFAAMGRLKEKGLTVQSMLDIPESELAEIIKPVGFYKTKAKHIKKTCAVLRDKYNDDIPKTVDDLCALPGVGPKMTYICMNAAWNENAGIGVDTHVHRIANRLKWTGKKGTSTPEETREALESWMPRDLWQEINILLVGFGQETCLPIGPKCSICLNQSICPAAFAPPKPKKKK